MPHDLDAERRLLLKRQERDRWLLAQDSFRSSPIIAGRPMTAPVPTTPAALHTGNIGNITGIYEGGLLPRSKMGSHRLREAQDSSDDSDTSGPGTESRAVARHWGRVWKARAMLRRSQNADVLQLRGQLSVTMGEPFLGLNSTLHDGTVDEGFGHMLLHATTGVPDHDIYCLEDLPPLTALDTDVSRRLVTDERHLEKEVEVAGMTFALGAFATWSTM